MLETAVLRLDPLQTPDLSLVKRKDHIKPERQDDGTPQGVRKEQQRNKQHMPHAGNLERFSGITGDFDRKMPNITPGGSPKEDFKVLN